MKEVLVIFSCVLVSVSVILGISSLREIHQDLAERSAAEQRAAMPFTSADFRFSSIESDSDTSLEVTLVPSEPQDAVPEEFPNLLENEGQVADHAVPPEEERSVNCAI